MRIRSTKPEFWRSRRIAEVDWEARFVLKGLESYVDDNGVGKDDLELIVGDLFSRDLSRDPSRTLKRVRAALNTLFEAGLIHRYVDNCTDLLYISWWESIQKINRPSNGRLRRPDGTLEYNQSRIGAPDVSPQEGSGSLSAGTGEQGNRGSEEQGISSLLPDESGEAADEVDDEPNRFDEWWDVYGKKVSKQDALAAWKTALKKPGVDQGMLLRTTEAYVDNLKAEGKHPKFAKDPHRWLKGQCWNDEREDIRNPAGAAAEPSRAPYPTAAEMDAAGDPPEDIDEYNAWYKALYGGRG